MFDGGHHETIICIDQSAEFGSDRICQCFPIIGTVVFTRDARVDAIAILWGKEAWCNLYESIGERTHKHIQESIL